MDFKQHEELSFKNVLEQAPVAISLLMGPEFIVQTANRKQLELWQRGAQEVINKKLFDIFPEVKSQAFKSILTEVYETGQTYKAVEQPAQFIRNGTLETAWFDFIYEPLKNLSGQVDGIMVTSVEVTERMQMVRKRNEQEAMLRKNQDTLSLGIAVAGLAIVEIDYSSNTARLSKEASRMYFGPDTEAQTILRDDIHQSFHPEDAPEIFRLMQQALDPKGNGNFQMEHRVVWRNGEVHWLRVSKQIFFAELNGTLQPTNGILAAQDVTDRKVAEKALEESQTSLKMFSKNLESIVAQRTKELQRSNEDLQQFVHVSSHDLKEPIRKVLVFASRLQDEFHGLAPADVMQYLSKINSAAKRSFEMVESVLRYSMVNSAEEKAEQVDLESLFKGIESDFEVLIERSKAAFIYKNLPVIESQRDWLQQLFRNLVGNALKFGKPGVPVQITIDTTDVASNTKTRLSLADDIPFICVSVSDNGIGFDQQYAQKIFDTFTQLNPKSKYDGTGMGLSVCKKIAQRLGGAIEAKGEEGAGASFMVYIPTVHPH
jgi:PAS domain S-box-containing protein